MGDEQTIEPGILTRIGWFFWRNWSRVNCATRGHTVKDNGICGRCGLPVPTWAQIEGLEAELEEERAERRAFHEHYVVAQADADALRDEHRG